MPRKKIECHAACPYCRHKVGVVDRGGKKINWNAHRIVKTPYFNEHEEQYQYKPKRAYNRKDD